MPIYVTINILGMDNENLCQKRKAIVIKHFERIFFLFVFLYILSNSHPCFAQRRDNSKRRDLAIQETKEIHSSEDKKREYEMIFEFGLGNFAFEEFAGDGASAVQSVYLGDMLSLKALFRAKEIGDTWTIAVSGEVFGSTYRLERWWSGQQLFRINKLMAQGFCMETKVRYHFDETALYPFPVLTRPNIGLGFIYRFHGIRRKDASTLIAIADEPPMAKETDFALFGIEPCLGFLFTMDDGQMTGYFDLGTGLYGVSIENNYEIDGLSETPETTFGRSILASVGLRGTKHRISYQIGYSIFRLKIEAKDTIQESRSKLDRVVCNIGMRF